MGGAARPGRLPHSCRTTMKPLSMFLPRLRPYAPGVPEPVAFQALVDAAIEFCEKTLVVRHTTDPEPLVSEVHTYDVDLPPGTAVARILNAWIGPRALSLATPPMTNKGEAYSEEGAHIGMPQAAYVEEPGTVRLYPTPGPDTPPLTLRVATSPLRTAQSLDDVLYDDWVDAVVGGALVRLALMPGTAFTSAEMAMYGSSMFVGGLSAARAEADKGRVRGDARVQMRPLAGGWR